MNRRPASVRLAAMGLATLLASQSANAFDWTGWITAFNQKMSSYRVLTKQKSVSSDKIAAATTQSFSAGATAVIAERQARLVRETVQRFSDQGPFACYGADVARMAGTVRLQTAVAARNASTQIAGWNLGSPGAQGADAAILHNNVYCSVSEHKMGLCKLNPIGLQSADSDFSLIVQPGTKSTSERAASYDYVDNILAQRSADMKCNSPDCAAQAVDARSFNAFASLARLSFVTTIEARSQQSTTPTN